MLANIRKSFTGKKKKKASNSKEKAPTNNEREKNVYFDEELEPVEVQMVPEDQLDLTEAELDEEFTKTLTSLDPNKPSKITHFNFKSGEFESKPNNQHIAIHLKQEGIIWSKREKEELEKLQKEKEKEEQEQNEPEQKEQEENADPSNPDNAEANEEQTDKEQEPQKEEEEEEDEEKNQEEKDQEEEEEETSTKKKKEILVKNQFNFSDRASQTFNEPLRDREIQTEPAPKSVFSQNANPAAIRDEYLNNLLKLKQQQLEEENKKKKTGFGASSNDEESNALNTNQEDSKNKIKHNDESDALLHSKEMLKALKIMERVTVLNANSESYHEFRYYKNSDYKRGAFLSRLWTFKYFDGNKSSSSSSGQQIPSSIANRMVTSLEWNKSHLDLFAVGYGSYSFNYQTSGMICIYSLKSTVHPEKIILCESGVMCMSFHPKYASLLCVGYYDGSVAVYDVRNRDDSPIYSSENPETHHSDPVWDVKWFYTELQHELIFYSISSDSEIKIWKMTQNELNHETLIKLNTPKIAHQQIMTANEDMNKNQVDKIEDVEDDDDDQETALQALCSCFDFNPNMDHLYLVGTEDGHIMECSKTYNDGFTKIYRNAHYMNVYCIKWNPFHNKIFLSCSEDWTIKLWEIEQSQQMQQQQPPQRGNNLIDGIDEEPIISYDLGNSVNDIAWSPFSSTTFAAVTSDGKVHIFDLTQNKNGPLCTEQITKKGKNIKLTKVSFPIGFPLIIVGDEKGNVYALKLSPNLYLDKVKHRDILKNVSPEMFDNDEFKEKEKEKLIKVLDVTGNKVFDVIEHFSPKKNKKIGKNLQSPKMKK